MARPKTLTPTYRQHKSSGQAVVTIDGHDHYLGVHGSRASYSRYHELIAASLSGQLNRDEPSPARPAEDAGPVLVEVLDKYLEHAQVYYAGSRELRNLLDVMDTLTRLFGSLPAEQFGPRALTAVRDAMIEGRHRAGRRFRLARTTINCRINRIRRIFRWAVAQQLVRPHVLQGLEALDPLRAGRTSAREGRKVRPVSDATVEATLRYLPETVRAMVRLQRITGMRSGELVIMRTGDRRSMTALAWFFVS
jgi:integrase